MLIDTQHMCYEWSNSYHIELCLYKILNLKLIEISLHWSLVLVELNYPITAIFFLTIQSLLSKIITAQYSLHALPQLTGVRRCVQVGKFDFHCETFQPITSGIIQNQQIQDVWLCEDSSRWNQADVKRRWWLVRPAVVSIQRSYLPGLCLLGIWR